MSRFFANCVRHRGHVEPESVAAIAAFRPFWSSGTTSATPESPRAKRLRRKAVQPAPSSVVMTSMPRTPQRPSAFTPVAMMTATSPARTGGSRELPAQANSRPSTHATRQRAGDAPRPCVVGRFSTRHVRRAPEALGLIAGS